MDTPAGSSGLDPRTLALLAPSRSRPPIEAAFMPVVRTLLRFLDRETPERRRHAVGREALAAVSLVVSAAESGQNEREQARNVAAAESLAAPGKSRDLRAARKKLGPTSSDLAGQYERIRRRLSELRRLPERSKRSALKRDFPKLADNDLIAVKEGIPSDAALVILHSQHGIGVSHLRKRIREGREHLRVIASQLDTLRLSFRE